MTFAACAAHASGVLRPALSCALEQSAHARYASATGAASAALNPTTNLSSRAPPRHLLPPAGACRPSPLSTTRCWRPARRRSSWRRGWTCWTRCGCAALRCATLCCTGACCAGLDVLGEMRLRCAALLCCAVPRRFVVPRCKLATHAQALLLSAPVRATPACLSLPGPAPPSPPPLLHSTAIFPDQVSGTNPLLL